MDHKRLEEIGENLRNLGHERRETVEAIIGRAAPKSDEARELYTRLDRISEQAISLMERQRDLVRQELGTGQQA